MPDENRRKRYPPIEEHGVIGDLHTVALVATDGTIDWYCCPSFDSPSVFASTAVGTTASHPPTPARGRSSCTSRTRTS